MKRLFWLSLIALGVLVFGQVAPASAANVLKIGVIGPVSGNYADHGALERMGMEMALKDLGGKIGGKTVEFVIGDSETNPDTAARHARSIIERDGVKFLMGGISSSESLAIGNVAKERGALYIATNGNADDLTSTKANRSMFRICPNMAMLGRANATYAYENLGKKWFFLTHDYSWGHSGTRWARDVMKKRGATEVGEVKIPLGTRDFSAQLLQIRNSDADVLIITCSGFDKIALLKQMAEYKIHDKLKVADNLNDYVDYWTVKPEERRGFGASELSYDETPMMIEASKRFSQMFPKAISPVIDCNIYNGYVGVMALNEAIEKAGTSDSVGKVIQAMEGLEVKRNLRDKPTYIDPRTHQMISSLVVIELDSKTQGTDFYKTLKKYNAADFEMTEAENPIDLRKEPLPQ